jgi:hypothetical protein
MLKYFKKLYFFILITKKYFKKQPLIYSRSPNYFQTPEAKVQSLVSAAADEKQINSNSITFFFKLTQMC